MKNGREVTADINEPYKAILIIGNGVHLPNYIMNLYKQQGWLLIGDGIQIIDTLDLSVLAGKVDKNTRINIMAHGRAVDGIHSIDGGFRTENFLRKISYYSGEIALKIDFFSCYGSASALDANTLPEGSVFIAHSSADEVSSTNIGIKTILKSHQDLSITDPVQSFVTKFMLKMTDTITIAIKIGNSVFKHTIQPPRRMLLNPHDIIKYFEYQRSEFIAAYHMALGMHIYIAQLPPITEQEALEWRNDNFVVEAMHGSEKLIKALQYNPADFSDCIDHSIGNYTTALMLAASRGYDHMVTALLAVPGIKVNAQDVYGDTALHKAIKKGYVNVVTALLAVPSINVNTQDIDGDTALHKAVKKGYADIVSVLLTSDNIDADVLATALKSAIKNGNDLIVRAFLKSGKVGDINQKDNSGYSALLYAAMFNQDRVTTTLLGVPGIDINAEDKNHKTALMWSASMGYIDVVTILLREEGINVNANDNKGYTALTLAIAQGHLNVVTELLKSDKVDINKKDEHGRTALMLAVECGDTDIVTALLNSGKVDDINAVNESGKTALMLAVEHGNASMVTALLDQLEIKADLKNKGITALMSAVILGRTDMISTLIASDKVNLNEVNAQGRTALILATMLNKDKIVATLLESGKVDTSIADYDGNTALTLAQNKNNINIISLLNSHNPDLNVKAQPSSPSHAARFAKLSPRTTRGNKAEAFRAEKIGLAARTEPKLPRQRVGIKRKGDPDQNVYEL